jgi:serine/threonine protein kinase
MTAAPERLGRYRVLRPLAQGGMAELFLARSSGIQGIEKLVVVKRVLPDLARDGDYASMFIDEARLAARMHHSNLVQVYDIGEADGLPFYAMEYLDGHDVRAIVRMVNGQKETLPLEHALSIVIGVAAGLHYAHEMRDEDGRPLGIVHRDVSPQNVAVTFDGGVKLFDFGVAKAKRRTTETRHGTLKGKLQYMSPEQCRGEEVDRRSDVFSCAILLWELTTGRRLFGGKSDFGVMKSIAEADAPKPSLVWPDCPSELEAIVMRGLRREPEARFSTAEELQLALEAFAREKRLAVSGVGLGKHLRRLYANATKDEVKPEISTLYELVFPDDEEPATVCDGVYSVPVTLLPSGELEFDVSDAPEPARARGNGDDDDSRVVVPPKEDAVPERHTRVARVAQLRRESRPPMAAKLLAVVAVLLLGGTAAWKLHSRATPLPPPAAPAPRVVAGAPTLTPVKQAPKVVVKVAPAAEPVHPTVTAAADEGSAPTAGDDPLVRDHGGREHMKSIRSAKHTHASRTKPKSISHAAAPTQAAPAPAKRPAVDLDAPLPPQ